jgi:tetratricopeptide (TPR) repeat protein
VLVAVYDGRAVPKVIDFGIAKAIENSRPESDESTRAGVMLGTFEYMSPEQTETNAADLDTRTDIYSLGALLYLLVCGTTPLYSPTQGQPPEPLGYGEILRRIREEVPVPASRVSGNPALRELDWILARALDKDRNRRYQSADGMARDLRRYLDGDPLEAGPPSTAYRLRKLAAKFKFWVAAAAALVILLLVASIALAFALRQQTRANASASALREVVRRIIIERPAQLAGIPNRTALRGQLMRDAEGALDALSQDAGNDGALQFELARAYLSIGLAKGPYNGMGSEGDPAGAANYVKKSVELYSVLARNRPDDAVLRRGQIEALSVWLHLQYRLVRPEEGENAARQLQTEIDSMSPELRDKIQARWYLSIGYLELGSILFGLGRESEALDLHRKALAAFREGVPSDWMKDPEKLDHLSHLQREVAISAWMYGGYSLEVESTARMAVKVVEGRSEPNCRMRHAQSEGTLGELEWASEKRNQGVATMRKSVAEFESLAAEDPQNAVFANAGAQVRAYLALALAGGAGGAEAVRLAAENLRLSAGADAKLSKGRERWMVYQVVLGAALSGAGRFDEAARELRDTLARNRDWNANVDIQWSALHLLTTALAAQGKYEEASHAGREALQLAVQSSGPGAHSRVLMAVAARDYAASVAHWKLASPDERTAALHALDGCCSRIDERYGVLAGALLEWPPKTAEMASIRNMLTKSKESMGKIR